MRRLPSGAARRRPNPWTLAAGAHTRVDQPSHTGVSLRDTASGGRSGQARPGSGPEVIAAAVGGPGAATILRGALEDATTRTLGRWEHRELRRTGGDAGMDRLQGPRERENPGTSRVSARIRDVIRDVPDSPYGHDERL